MLPFDKKNVPVSRVDIRNPFFRITTEQKILDLVKSLETVGIVNPPILLPETSGFIVVSGFRRIAAATRLGWDEIPARLLPESFSNFRCAQLAITENTSQRPLNLIEISRCLVLLNKFLKPSQSLAQKAAALGLPEGEDFCKKVKPLALLPWPVQEILLNKNISLPTALNLAKLNFQDAIRLANLFMRLQCSLNRQRELMDLISDLGLLEDKPIGDLLDEFGFRSIIENEDLDKNQKTRHLIDYLKRRLYPAITAAENHFEKQVQKLNLGNRIQLTAPKYFEGRTYRLCLHFDSLAELTRHFHHLEDAVSGPVFKKILQ